MREVAIFAREFESVDEIHEFLSRELDFPEYYGGNLSALYDVLTDICEETSILLDGTGIAQGELCGYITRMAQVFLDAREDNPYLEVELVNI